MQTVQPAKVYPGPLGDFAEQVRSLVAVTTDPHEVAAGVEARLAPLLKRPGLLAPEHREPWPDRYRQHVLYVAPDGAFSIVSLVWSCGQFTPIHDHVCWCVVGVHEGLERESRYRLMSAAPGDEGAWLEPQGSHIVWPGQTCALVPPEEDIHRVENACEGVAVSIHVYGADIGRLGTSINRRFDGLPVRRNVPGHPVHWRMA